MAFTEENRELFVCKEDYFKIDKYGYCCDPEHLYDPAADSYPEPAEECTLTACMCKPITVLDKNLVKDNMVNNGEFVSRLDAAMRYKLVQLSAVEKCIASARTIPDEWNNHLLLSNDSVKFDKEIDITMTVLMLKRTVDPLNDYAMVKHLAKELDEWIAMFYSPCLAAIYGMNIGTTPSTDTSYFMAYPWYRHPECMHLTCLTNNFRWDRESGGCVPGLITGSDANGYGDGADDMNENCAQDEEAYDDTPTCKHSSAELSAFHGDVTNCWSNTLPSPSVDYLINHFCNPRVSPYVAPQSEHDATAALAAANCPDNSAL
jgi:hypothetical protein